MRGQIRGTQDGDIFNDKEPTQKLKFSHQHRLTHSMEPRHGNKLTCNPSCSLARALCHFTLRVIYPCSWVLGPFGSSVNGRCVTHSRQMMMRAYDANALLFHQKQHFHTTRDDFAIAQKAYGPLLRPHPRGYKRRTLRRQHQPNGILTLFRVCDVLCVVVAVECYQCVACVRDGRLK